MHKVSICCYSNSEYTIKENYFLEDSLELGAWFKMGEQFSIINGNVNVYKAKRASKPIGVLHWIRKKLWMCTGQGGTRMCIYLSPDPLSQQNQSIMLNPGGRWNVPSAWLISLFSLMGLWGFCTFFISFSIFFSGISYFRLTWATGPLRSCNG